MMVKRGVVWSSAGMQAWGKRDISKNIRQPAASSGTIPTCDNPRATPPGIEQGAKWWQFNSKTWNYFPSVVANLIGRVTTSLPSENIHRNPNEPQEAEMVHGIRQERNRFKNIEWSPYEAVHKKYLNLGTLNHFKILLGRTDFLVKEVPP
ncbi:hypothetical protein PR048_027088 [Dryococelus australis]|uniref:Uncharacterized protein n=1 Tax=Dryococelus australis TaxID=614101 RepID=A0ABQ9GEH0_9NEOP|nr:hypothetical protein PR048_027088 [Dryococelus australis]